MPKPFQQLPFDALPDLPRIPHGLHLTRSETVVVVTPGLGGIPVHYRTFGEGPPLLLVHGLMTSSYSFRYVVEPLGRRFRLFVPDLPGAGETPWTGEPLGPEVLAAFLGAFQEAVGITGCACVANSMGGYLAMRLALAQPRAFSRLVNLHSPGLPLKRLRLLRAVLATPGSEALLQALVRRDPERWAHRNVHYWDETLKSREEARTYGAPLSTPSGRSAFASYLRDTLDPREMAVFEATLRGRRDRGEPFPIPLLLLYAEQDPMVPPVVGDRLRALLPDARFERLREASHFAHVDNLGAFMGPTLRFLAG